ncbi:MAG: peptidylprolyl isomerase [Alphaproteobacteria bacterium]|nr:peptidylprolyl isomerase [Alphaproteobacteria bacterium]
MNKFLLLLCGCGAVVVDHIHAKDLEQPVKYEGIIAIVNGEIITVLDLDDQVKIAVLVYGMKDSAELRVEILKNMITEKIRWGLLKKFVGRVDWGSKKDVERSFASIAERHNMKSKNFSNLLVSKGINLKAFKHSIRVNLSWIEYVKTRYGENVNLTERELEAILKNIKENKEKESFLVSRMYFPVTDSSSMKAMKDRVYTINRMVSQNTRFGELARKFSKSPDAGNGGDLGWIREGQLSPEEDFALKTMKIGEARVVQNSRGFYILQLRDKREAGKDSITHLRFVQVGVFRPEYANGQDTWSLINQLKKHYPNAKAFIDQARTIGCSVSGLQSAVLETMTPEVRKAVEHCPVNGLSQIISNEQALFIFCILDRREEKIPEPTLDDIRNQKINEKFGIFSDREFFELKKWADIKIKDERYGKTSDFVSQL